MILSYEVIVYSMHPKSHYIAFDQTLSQYTFASRISKDLGLVVQSIVSLTTSLRRQLVKFMWTTLSNTLLFFVEKM